MTVELRNGDTLRLTCSFQHQGKAISGVEIYAAIGKAGTLLGFDELQGYTGRTVVLGIQNDIDVTTYEVSVDIPIKNIEGFLGPKAGSIYEVYAKITRIPGPDIFWYGPEDDITLVAPLGEAEFQNLVVSYGKA